MSNPLDVLYEIVDNLDSCASWRKDYIRLMAEHADLIADVIRAAEHIHVTHLRYLDPDPLGPALDALKAALAKEAKNGNPNT